MAVDVSEEETTEPGAEVSGPRRGRPDRLTAWIVGGVLVLVLSVLTVLRRTVDYLQADGVQQSIMSIQDVDLFFWGQNRFAAFVSLLASPIADPGANLFACLLINAVAFHLLLLTIAWMGVRVVTGGRERWATIVLFLVIAATAHLVLTPWHVHVMALESQPYSASWALTLGAFLLWKRREPWAFAVATAMVGIAVGLNQSTILVAAFVAVIELARRRAWVRWIAFGAMWLVWFGIWAFLAARFGGTAGPIPDAPQNYFTFDVAQFVRGAPQAMLAVFAAFRPIRLVALLCAACVALLLLRPERRILLPRLALALLFCTGYWALFAGNPWVAQNGYVFRYFYPVVLFGVLCLAVPLAAVLIGWCLPDAVLVRQVRIPAMRDTRVSRAVVAAVATLGCVVGLAGPLAAPTSATVLVQSRATADFAREHDVRFLAGYYWDMWPILHRTLEDGRNAAFVTGFKSGGDRQSYTEAFEEELAESDGPPLALCVNDATTTCVTYLEYWTRPGWIETDQSCPVPGPTGQLGYPEVRRCVVLEYTGA